MRVRNISCINSLKDYKSNVFCRFIYKLISMTNSQAHLQTKQNRIMTLYIPADIQGHRIHPAEPIISFILIYNTKVDRPYGRALSCFLVFPCQTVNVSLVWVGGAND